MANSNSNAGSKILSQGKMLLGSTLAMIIPFGISYVVARVAYDKWIEPKFINKVPTQKAIQPEAKPASEE